MPDKPKPVIRKPEVSEPFSALAFKTGAKRNSGLVFIRIYSGELRPGDTVLNTVTNKKERISHIYQMAGEQRERLEVAGPGRIVALGGLKATASGHTLCATRESVAYERCDLPEPVLAQPLLPAQNADKQELADAVANIVDCDPTLRMRTDPESNRVILSGLGESHLKVAVHKLKRDYGLSFGVGKPMVAYRQTLSSPVEIETSYIKQIGSLHKYAVIKMRYEPLAKSDIDELGGVCVAKRANQDNIFFADTIFGVALPSDFIPYVEAGFRSACQKGLKYKVPCVDIKATLVDGHSHVIDSTPDAFRSAAQESFREAQAKVGTTLLEPIMHVIVEAPSQLLPNLTRDVCDRRGEIIQAESHRNRCELRAHVPLAELSDYSNEVHDFTGGSETFSMEPSHYAPVREDVVDLRAAC